MRLSFQRIWFRVSLFSSNYSPIQKLYIRFIETDLSRGFINNNLLDLLEELRIRMHMDMSEELGIPRMDPFFIEELNLEPILNELV